MRCLNFLWGMMGMDLNGGAGEVGYAAYGFGGVGGEMGGFEDHLGLEMGYVMNGAVTQQGEMGMWGVVGQAQQA